MSIGEKVLRQGIIVRETYQYLKRDFKKYSSGALGMIVLFGHDFEQGDAFRSTYYLFRHIDDVLDGDRHIDEDPFTYTARLRSSIEHGEYDTAQDPILLLAKRSMEHFNKVKRPGDDPQNDVLQLIDAMVGDRQRMLTRRVITGEELTEEYRRQFYPIQNLQLIALESNLRVNDIPDFPIIQGRVYAIKDLQGDWERGLINIPLEVLAAAGLDSDADFTTVRINQVVRRWIIDECIDCGQMLDIENQRLADGLHSKKDRVSRVIFEHLTDSLAKFLTRTVSNDNENEDTVSKQSDNVHSASAIGEALRTSFRYRKDLKIKPSELVQFTTKSSNLAACYAGFAQQGTNAESLGAGKAAFLSCAYDVVTDWNKPPDLREVFERILDAEVSPELKSMAIGLLERDITGQLQYDGLERGIVALRFVLELMGLQEEFEHKTNINTLGINLQIVDDILDYESDVKVGDTNCLTSTNRNQYLRQVIDAFSDDGIAELFPHAGILGIALKKARNKAQNMLSMTYSN